MAALCLIGTLAGCGQHEPRDPRVLRVWLLEPESPELQQGYDNLVADFQRRHPGVRVDLSEVPYLQYRDKLVLAAQGGTEPDVMQLDQIFSPEFAAAGLIKNIRPMLGSKIRPQQYFPGAWESNQWGGGTWGMPLYTDVWERMYYNAELFRRAGLDPRHPPRTWPQWLDAARRLDQLPGISGISLIGCRDEASSVLTDSLVYSAGGRIAAGRRAVFDSPANRRAYSFYQQLARYAPAGVAAACDDDSIAHFTAGTTGMVLAGGWKQGELEESATFDWRQATPPAPQGRAFTGALGGYNLAVSRHAPNTKLAVDFLRLATTSRRHQLEINDSVPALRSAGEQYVRESRRDPAEMLRLLNSAKPRPITPAYPKISLAQQDAVQAILGGADVGEALRGTDGVMQTAIEEP